MPASKFPESSSSSVLQQESSGPAFGGSLRSFALALQLGLAGVAVFGAGCHQHKPATPEAKVVLNKIPFERLTAVTESYKKFSKEVNAEAATVLLAKYPGFRDVIKEKERTAEGKPIQIIFIEEKPTGKLVVGFCKDGLICPCKPDDMAFYRPGEHADRAKADVPQATKQVIDVLYNADGSRK